MRITFHHEDRAAIVYASWHWMYAQSDVLAAEQDVKYPID